MNTPGASPNNAKTLIERFQLDQTFQEIFLLL